MNTLRLFWEQIGTKAYLVLLLSLMSGGISAFTISLIYKLLDMQDGIKLYFFPIVIILGAIITKVNSEIMLKINSELIYDLRKTILSKVQKISLINFEKKNQDNESFVYGVLTRDINTIGGIPENMIGFLTNIFLVLGCIIYLSIQSIIGTFVVIFVVAIALTVYNIVTRSLRKFDQETRRLIDVHFHNVNTLVRGFREFKLDHQKNDDFKVNHMDKSSEDLKSFRLKFGFKLINANIVNSAIIFTAIGLIIFMNSQFSLFDKDLQSLFILTFIFMSGPIEGLNGTIPFIIQVETSLKRVREIEAFFDSENEYEGTVKLANDFHWEKINCKNLQFSYKSKDEVLFDIGPIDLTINRGETIFVAGGNGSGKTTFVKLLLSLYEPDSGEILLNDHYNVQNIKTEYRDLFSVIFSDNFLFKRFFGYQGKLTDEENNLLIEKVKMTGKVKIEDSQFDTVDLSMGQRKRLSLIHAYVEDKEIIVMDEFTADQDPSFREYFYNIILPELKKMGKTLIIITHDDRYYERGDRLLKMFEGRLEEIQLEKV